MARVRPRESKATFATRLCSLMDERGLTAAETIRRMKEHLPEGESISHGSLSHYRRGRAIPRLRRLDALGIVLGVDKFVLMSPPQSEPSKAQTKPLQRSKRDEREARRTATDGDITSIVPAEATQRIVIEDHGEEAYPKIEQRMSWDVALRILDALKRNRSERDVTTMCLRRSIACVPAKDLRLMEARPKTRSGTLVGVVACAASLAGIAVFYSGAELTFQEWSEDRFEDASRFVQACRAGKAVGFVLPDQCASVGVR